MKIIIEKVHHAALTRRYIAYLKIVYIIRNAESQWKRISITITNQSCALL